MKTDTDDKQYEKFKKLIKVKATRVGQGVFARRNLSVESVVGEITGQVIELEYASDYTMDLGNDKLLEPGWPFRFLNHSCDPNCELMLWKYRKVKGEKIQRIWLNPLRDVVAGEELTIDYAWPAEVAVPCLCGTEVCRGWVVDQREIRKLPRMVASKQNSRKLSVLSV